ncbi:MAG: stage III sporulation protein AE [Clostridia bacterium]|nr:stage III sporulation protein AE [Clostridia bacterium]
MKIKNFLYKKKNYRLKTFFLLILLIIIPMCSIQVSADSSSENNEWELYVNTYEALDEIDFSKLNDIFKDYDLQNLFHVDFETFVTNIVEGDLHVDAGTIFQYLFDVLFYHIKKILPALIIILVVAVVLKCLECFSPTVFKDGILDIINFIAVGFVVVVLSSLVLGVDNVISDTIASLQNIINLLFPILLVLLSGMGAYSSVAIYTPISSILTTGISNVLSNYLYPIFIISFVLIIIASLSNKLKIDKFIDFLFSLFKWGLGFVFTIFSGVFALKGISAGKYDSVSIFTTKFAIKNYVPLIGSYISEGFNYVVLGSMLVKNAIGIAGVVFIVLVILSPLIYLIVAKLLLQLLASILEIVGSFNIVTLLTKVSKIFVMPIAVLMGVGFMFIICISLVICTANII